MLEALVIRWGYLAIAFGIFLEGESVLILGGAMAHRGLLSLPLVMLVAFLSAFAGDQFWFQMGRRYGRPLIERHPKWLARLGGVQARLQRYGDVFVFGFRFVYGIRTVTPVLLGMTDYPRARFVCLNLAGVAVWSVAISWAGWALGAAFQRIMDRAMHAQKLVAGVLVAALCVWLVLTLLRRRAS
jgi:membrane protein DedA with SNARE-associated domain